MRSPQNGQNNMMNGHRPQRPVVDSTNQPLVNHARGHQLQHQQGQLQHQQGQLQRQQGQLQHQHGQLQHQQGQHQQGQLQHQQGQIQHQQHAQMNPRLPFPLDLYPPHNNHNNTNNNTNHHGGPLVEQSVKHRPQPHN